MLNPLDFMMTFLLGSIEKHALFYNDGLVKTRWLVGLGFISALILCQRIVYVCVRRITVGNDTITK